MWISISFVLKTVLSFEIVLSFSRDPNLDVQT